MKITGYKLREAIKTWELRRQIAENSFTESLTKFPDEKKQTPEQVHAMFVQADRSIAKLNTAQARYNLVVNVEAMGQKMTLCEAIKTVGGAGRAQKLWENAASQKRRSSLYGGDDVRKDDEIRAERTISHEAAVKQATQAAKFAGQLRAAIASANVTDVEIEDLEATLFE
jgi:hypothetical protein